MTPLGTTDVPWPDESGPWTLTCALARVGQRIELVSLTVTGDGSTPVDAALWRSIRIGEVAQSARLRLTAQLALSGELDKLFPQQRPRTSTGDSLVSTAALLWADAEAAAPRSPSKQVADWLRADGWEVTDGQVRTALSRARQRDMIPPALVAGDEEESTDDNDT